jgi:hypothetical protein
LLGIGRLLLHILIAPAHAADKRTRGSPYGSTLTCVASNGSTNSANGRAARGTTKRACTKG